LSPERSFRLPLAPRPNLFENTCDLIAEIPGHKFTLEGYNRLLGVLPPLPDGVSDLTARVFARRIGAAHEFRTENIQVPSFISNSPHLLKSPTKVLMCRLWD
jgi:hypothetical protein